MSYQVQPKFVGFRHERHKESKRLNEERKLCTNFDCNVFREGN